MSVLDISLMILNGLPWTFALTLGAFFIGAILGLPLLGLRQSSFWPVRLIALIFIQIIRALPPILWLFIIFFGIGMTIMPINPFVAALIVFGLIATANMAEVYRGALASLHHGQFEAARALNFSRIAIFIDIVAPQMLRVAIPSAASYMIGLMKETAVASTIGMSDLVSYGRAVEQITQRGFEVYAIVGLFYILLSLPVAWASRRADSYLRAKVAR